MSPPRKNHTARGPLGQNSLHGLPDGNVTVIEEVDGVFAQIEMPERVSARPDPSRYGR